MFCSVVIPTVGRPTLSRAVHSVLNQEFGLDDFEVIVVNDSGQPLPEAKWQKTERVRLLKTNRRERCVARNAGAALAKGRYLCFLDDDDWLLPDALQHFWELAQRESEAVWLYGGIRVVDGEGKCIAEANSGLNGECSAQIIGGAWAPIQASLTLTEVFFDVGGYDPAICGTEDLDLCSRVALRGRFASTQAVVACLLRGENWDTSTNYLRAPEEIRYSRDKVLSEPGAFRHLRLSASSDYWRGRILRVYSSTVTYNMRHRRMFTAVSRVVTGMVWFVLAGKHTLSRGFWEGVRAHHAPGTLHFIMKALEGQTRKSQPG